MNLDNKTAFEQNLYENLLIADFGFCSFANYSTYGLFMFTVKIEEEFQVFQMTLDFLDGATTYTKSPKRKYFVSKPENEYIIKSRN